MAFVKRNVLSPLRALITGPSIESGPIQYSRMAVDRPSARDDFFLSTSRWNRPLMSSLVPMIPPKAIDMMNSTGYWLFGRLVIVAFSPMARLANPSPSYSTRLYFSLIPRCSTVPTIDPMIIVHVFTIVPNIITKKLIPEHSLQRQVFLAELSHRLIADLSHALPLESHLLSYLCHGLGM